MNCAGDAGCVLSDFSEKHDQKQMWETAHHMRLRAQFCDAVLVADGVRFPVHRAILAANSPYFRQLFTRKSPLAAENEIMMSEIDAPILSILLDYIYTRQLRHVTMETVEKVFHHAERLMIRGVVEHCRVYLLSMLTPTNALEILKLAKDVFSSSMVDQVFQYVLKNFAEVVSDSMEFVHLHHEQLLQVISDDDLNVRSEEEVFEAVLHWIDHKPSSRAQLMPTLLAKIRLGFITPEYFIDNISSHRYIRMNEKPCAAIISTAWDILYNQHRHGDISPFNSHYLLRPRVPHEVLFVIGGWSGGTPVSYIETYDSFTDRWYTHPDVEDEFSRAYHGTVALGSRIYVLGGFDGSHYYSSVRCFDAVEKTWTPLAPMYQQRCYVSATTSDGKIYACGGYDGRWRLDSAERYDPSLNQWETLPEMIHRRSDASAAALLGKVYVAGGFDGEECLSSVDVFDPDTWQWTLVPPMSCARSGVAVCSLHGFVFAIGGFDGQRRLHSGEKYCPLTKTWYPIADMYLCRSNGACAVIDEQILAAGGFNGSFTISEVECYNDEKDEWVDASEMNVNRSAVCACVLSGLPNAREYTHHGCETVEHSL